MDSEPIFQGQSSNYCVNPQMVLYHEPLLTSIDCVCIALSAQGHMPHDSQFSIQSVLRKQSLDENEEASHGLFSP